MAHQKEADAEKEEKNKLKTAVLQKRNAEADERKKREEERKALMRERQQKVGCLHHLCRHTTISSTPFDPHPAAYIGGTAAQAEERAATH